MRRVATGFVLFVATCVVGVVGLGVFPGRWMDLARIAVGG